MRATLSDIARQVGVTMTTASYVLNNKPGTRISAETRRKILDLAKKLNYQPDHHARSLATGRSNAIGVVFCGDMASALRDPYSIDLARGMILQASQVEQAIQMFVEGAAPRRHGVDGWIAVMATKPLPVSQTAGLPVLYCDPRYRIDDHCYWARNEEAGVLLAEKVARRHQRVLFLLHEPLGQSPYAYLKRSDGFCQTFGRIRGPVAVFTDVLSPLASEEEAARFVAKWRPVFERREVTAVVCVSDMLASRCVGLLFSHGLNVPADVEVAGFDNTVHSQLASPAISTVDVGSELLGKESVRCLLLRVAGKTESFSAPAPKWIPRATMPNP